MDKAISLVRITYLSRIFIPFMWLSFIQIQTMFYFCFFYHIYLRADTLYSGKGAVRQRG